MKGENTMTKRIIKILSPLFLLLSLTSCSNQADFLYYYGHYKNDFIDFENKRATTCGGTIILNDITYAFEMDGDNDYYFYFHTPKREDQFCLDETNLIWKFNAYDKGNDIELTIIKDFVSDYTGKKVILSCIENYRKTS